MHRRKFGWLIGSAVATVGLAEAMAEQDSIESSDWSGWRGERRTAYSQNRAWPSSLKETNLRLQWTRPFRKSYSGPIVSADVVVTTESLDAEEQVIAMDRVSGEVRWSSKWSGSMSVPFFAASNGSWIRSTPITDGSRVFVGGMCDHLACLSLSNGETLYSIDFTKRFNAAIPSFGQVCSPLLDQGRLYLQAGGGVVALDAASGNTIWRVKEEKDPMMGSAFSSPVIASLHGKRQLIVQTRNSLCGLELESGNLLWEQRVEAFRGMNILTPTVWDNCLFTSSYGGKSQLLELEPSDSDLWKVRERWSHKSEGYMSTPLVIDDHLYMHLRNQRMICIDLKNGEEKWRSRPYGKYWSMITNGQQILSLDEQGKLFLLEANPVKFNLIDERKISDEECWAHLALSGSQLFVRHLQGLTAFEWT